MTTSFRGFSLLEVLIATAILAGAMLVIGTMWSGNSMRVRKSNLYNNVAFLLESKIAEIEAKYKDKALTEIPESDGGAFDGYPNYSWKMESKEFEMPDLSAVLTKQNNGAKEEFLSMIKQMTEYISKAIKEVKVTIIVKSGKKEVPFSITTYFVSYDQDFALGGGAK